jgi:hypothetical protein
MLQFGVAKELGKTLSEVRSTMTAEELLGWSAYFCDPQRGPGKGNAGCKTPPLTTAAFYCVDCWNASYMVDG